MFWRPLQLQVVLLCVMSYVLAEFREPSLVHCKVRPIFEDFLISEVCSQGSNWQYLNIISDNGLAPNRHQAIIWANADPIHWHIYASLWEMSYLIEVE